jgi:hypothetical protein
MSSETKVLIEAYFVSIIGEDKTLSIKVGTEAGEASTEDVILVRGASSDVDRAVNEILRIIENAKNDEIVNSYVSCRFVTVLRCSVFLLMNVFL